MAAFALVVHRFRDEAVRVARETAAWLHERGHEVRLPLEDADLVDVPECGVDPEKLAAGLDLAISLGGDGTILRSVELVAKEEKVVGGQLGRPSGARFRTYERLKHYADEIKGTLFDSCSESARLRSEKPG